MHSQACLAAAVSMLLLVAVHGKELACAESGYCSLDKVKPYVGDVTPSEPLMHRACMAKHLQAPVA